MGPLDGNDVESNAGRRFDQDILWEAGRRNSHYACAEAREALW
jgi:hypothetical protein